MLSCRLLAAPVQTEWNQPFAWHIRLTCLHWQKQQCWEAALALNMHRCPDCYPVCLLTPCRPALSSISTLGTTVPADNMPVFRANQPELWSGPCGLLHQLDQCPPCRLHVPGQALCARGVWQAGGMPSCHSAHLLSLRCPLQHAQCSLPWFLCALRGMLHA